MVILKKPWLALPAEVAHSLSHPFLKIYGHIASADIPIWNAFQWRGLQFHNPLGIAGGVDKNADFLNAFWALGAGFIEIGTITPEEQLANPGKILDRSLKNMALWNKMGFPNHGVQVVAQKLQKLSRPYKTPVFINIGKNRTTANADAARDYLFCIRELRKYADAFVVNISSPNTSGLRELLEPNNLKNFLSPLVSECANKIPLLLKLSPDIDKSTWTQVIDESHAAGIDGWIISNTTLDRKLTPHWPNEGGVSGLPLQSRSEELLRLTSRHLGAEKKNKLLISVGGILTPEDVFTRLKLGADLVQIYSALIFYGPHFFHDTARLARR